MRVGISTMQEQAKHVANFQCIAMDNMQEECSVHFTLSCHAHCAQMQRVFEGELQTDL